MHDPHHNLPSHFHTLKPIVVAECASTAVSMGAVLALSQNDATIAPVRDFIATHFIYPSLAHKPAKPGIDRSDPLYDKACKKAAVLVKGGVMVGAGFASHVPIQLAMEGHFDAKSFHQVMLAKGAGIGVALGSIFLLEQIMPEAMPSLQKAICPVLAPYLPQGCDHGCTAAEEACHLMTVEIPSSVISGLVNYTITRRRLHTG